MSRHRLRAVVRGDRAIAAFAVLSLTVTPSGAAAHEDAVLTAAHSIVAAGDSLQLAGREFDAGKDYELRLVGPLRDYVLGSVRADSVGRFVVAVETPWEALPGSYQLTATADDGDIVARADLAVHASREDAGAVGSDTNAAVARRGHVNVGATRSAVEWSIIGLLISGSGILGLWSVIRSSRSSP
jgi:hypothetical protein